MIPRVILILIVEKHVTKVKTLEACRIEPKSNYKHTWYQPNSSNMSYTLLMRTADAASASYPKP